jgi:hypothetical protein
MPSSVRWCRCSSCCVRARRTGAANPRGALCVVGCEIPKKKDPVIYSVHPQRHQIWTRLITWYKGGVRSYRHTTIAASAIQIAFQSIRMHHHSCCAIYNLAPLAYCPRTPGDHRAPLQAGRAARRYLRARGGAARGDFRRAGVGLAPRPQALPVPAAALVLCIRKCQPPLWFYAAPAIALIGWYCWAS